MVAMQDNFVDPANDPRVLAGKIPQATDPVSPPKEVEMDFKKMVRWTKAHVENASIQRNFLERAWTKVDWYMAGFHYFTMDANGLVRSVPKKEGEIRATYPLMRSHYRRELGRFTDNILTVHAYPRSTKNPQAFYKAQSSEMMLNHWIEEVSFADTFEDWASKQIHYGLSALYRYKDEFRQQVFEEAWSARELFPLPWDTTKDSQLQGLTRMKRMSREWLAQNVSEQAAQKAGRVTSGLGVGASPISGSMGGGGWGGKYEDAADVYWTWLLPTPKLPYGMHYLIVEDQIFIFDVSPTALRNGKLPVEFSRYSKQQGNWYGMGMLATLIGPQGEADRQASEIIRGSRFNNGLLLFDSEVVRESDLEDWNRHHIAFDQQAYGSQQPFYYYLPPTPRNRDVDISLNMALESGRIAAGHESDILLGKAEGRVESGPLGQILSANAQAPIAPTLSCMYRGLFQSYPDILDMCGEVWPPDKRIHVIGRYELAEELVLAKEQRPRSSDVILRPGALLPAGRMESANLLFKLRSVVGDDRQPEITSAEFKRGLAALHLSPPGVELVSSKDQRVQQRVAALYNDGRTPGAFFSNTADRELMKLEDVQALHDALVDVILDPAKMAVASPQVKQAFLIALKSIRSLKLGDSASDGFDVNTDMDAYDARRSEEYMDALENDPEADDGIMSYQGLPIGVT